MRLIFFLLLQCLLLLEFCNANAQSIEGTLTDSNGNSVENARISFWSSQNKEILLGYIYSNQEGFYLFQPKSQLKTVFIDIASLNHKTSSKFITIPINKVSVKSDFLLEPKEIELEELVIKNETKAIKVKNDTVFYDPKNFLNGTERKVEDLLKKLPGMNVNEQTGEIQYKGKSIETVKLEDDDLFGGSYSLGTKNISVDMVEQVQAIENYSSNLLLKGIENSDKVVINLKLKKQKTDYSGSGTVTNGFGNKLLFNDEIALLGVSKRIKSFGILRYNNFGLDSERLTVFSESYNPGQLSNEELYAKKNIYESLGNSSLPNSRTKLNNTFFSNYNLIYKISPRISIKNNLVYYYDKSEAFELYKNNYFLNNGTTIENSQENKYYKKPNYYSATAKLTYNVNKKSLLVIDFNMKYKIMTSAILTLQNKENQYNTTLKTNDFFINSKTEYTIKIAEKKALQFFSAISKNNVPQELTTLPENNFITGNGSNSSTQCSIFEKQFLYNKLTYLESRKKIKQTFSLGFLAINQPFKSSLREDNVINADFKNDLVYKKHDLFGEYSSVFAMRKFKFEPSFSLNLYHQNLENNIILKVQNRDDFVFSSNVLVSYLLNSLSFFYVNGALENKTPNEEYLFTNNVLISNTTVKKNIASLDFIKSKNVSLGYKYYDLFNQFTFNLSLNYSSNKNTFLGNVTINPNFTTYTYFQSPVKIENKNITSVIEKQIINWKLTVKHTSVFSFDNYKNAIDNFELRGNKSKTYTSDLVLLTFFDFPINFENALNYQITSFKSDNGFKSDRISISNKFKLVVRPSKKWILAFSNEYYSTDTKSNSAFSFIDFDVKYQSSKLKWLSFNLIGKNLGNVKMYTKISNSDYSYSVYQSNLIPRCFLASMNVNF